MKKLTAPEKRDLIKQFLEGKSIVELAMEFDSWPSVIEEVIRSEAIKRERARK